MKTNTIKSIVKATGILNIVGAVLCVLSLVVGLTVAASEGAIVALNSPLLNFLKILLAIVGIATFVLAILLLTNLKKVNQKKTAAILTLIAGVFSLIWIYVSLVLWIIAAVQLLRMKFGTADGSANDSNPFIS